MLATVWFVLVAFMLTVYVILDGFDLGVGALHLYVGRTERERATALETIGPVWDGNEVWLVAGGGTLFFAFPTLYAVGFSGFYLPLILVLWLLMFRGLAIELRSHVDSRVWRAFWDAAFTGSSGLLAFLFGAALGNVVRGVPLREDGMFFSALFTNFRLDGDLGILDWYTTLVALTALATLTLHGALWLALRTTGPVRERAAHAAARLWWIVVVGTVLITVATFTVQPLVGEAIRTRPWGLVFPALGAAGLFGARVYLGRARPGPAFLASCVFIFGMLASAAWSVYPYVLPGRGAGVGLRVDEAAAAAYGLRLGLYWWLPGIVLATAYFAFNYAQLFEVDRDDAAPTP